MAMLVITRWYPYANHGAGIFTYKTGSFLGHMLVNIPAPWSIWVINGIIIMSFMSMYNPIIGHI